MNKIASKISWILLLILAGAAVYLLLKRNRAENDFADRIKGYEQQIGRLGNERDSLYRALSLREQQYREILDSLDIMIIQIQTTQRQNRIQYENRRDSIILLPDDERYRYVTGYIERYGSRAER
ncbi:MAG: hypothetical protein LBQ60_13690 [Bacteroidales bacterium]|nr:hypothetical protein [Bacteroidales bacterium]